MLLSAACLLGLTPGYAQGVKVKGTATKVVKNAGFAKSRVKALSRAAKAEDGIKVIYQQKVNDKITLKIVKDDKGRVYKVMDDGSNRSMKYPEYKGRRAAETGVAFSEDFEEWQDSYGYNWIPEGWTEKNTEGNTPTQEMLDGNVNNTWYTYYTGDGYWLPATKDGEKDCFIHFTYSSMDGQNVQFTASPQDEWLITPEIAVKAGQKLYFASSVELNSLFDLDYSTMKYDKNTIACDLEVQISTDNGATWTRLWRASDLVKDMDDKTIWNTKADYRDFEVDLADYADKNVKIAFRYINQGHDKVIMGNSLAIDAVQVATPMPVASYSMPYGSLFSGLSENLYVQNSAIAVMPAYVDNVWASGSNEFTESNEWSFELGTDGENTVETGDTVTMNYPYGEFPMPTLTASNQYADDLFTWGEGDENQAFILAGGSITDEDGTSYGLGNYDFTHHKFATYSFSDGAYCFGTGGDSYYQAKLVGVGNKFEKPTSPLFTDRAYLTLQYFDADPDAELDVNVYELTSDGRFGDKPLAHGKAKAGDAAYDAEGKLYTLPFDLYAVTDDKGTQAEKPGVVIDKDVVMEITGFADNSKVRSFAAMTQAENHDSGKNFAYLNFDYTDENGNTSTVIAPASEILEDFNSSLILSLRGEFSFLKADRDNVAFAKDGGTEAVGVMSYDDPAWWTVSFNGKEVALGTSATLDWLTITPSFDSAMRKVTLSFKAGATEQDRELTFTVKSHGVEQAFTVSQSATSGISNATAKGNATVAVDGNVVNVSCGKQAVGVKVTLFGADGKVAGSTLTDADGTASLNASSLPKGIYMVQVGTKTVKVVK